MLLAVAALTHTHALDAHWVKHPLVLAVKTMAENAQLPVLRSQRRFKMFGQPTTALAARSQAILAAAAGQHSRRWRKRCGCRVARPAGSKDATQPTLYASRKGFGGDRDPAGRQAPLSRKGRHRTKHTLRWWARESTFKGCARSLTTQSVSSSVQHERSPHTHLTKARHHGAQ